MVTLRDLYIVELSDLLDAEDQILRELPLMSARASSAALRTLFDEHYRETQRHRERLDELFGRLDERPRAPGRNGIRGLIEEARDRHAAWPAGDVLDAALIAAARRLEHYEIAAYASVRGWAAKLGDAEGARVLQQTLDEEGRVDNRLAQLADGIDEPKRARAAAATAPAPPTRTDASAAAAVAPASNPDFNITPESELMIARGEPDWRSEQVERDRRASEGAAMKERQRNEDARGGDVIVNDSIASGRPDLPIDQDPGRETNVAINADELGRNKIEETQPIEKRD